MTPLLAINTIAMYDIVLISDPRYINSKVNTVYYQNVYLENQLVQKALENEGLRVKQVAWDDPNFNWSTTKYGLFRAVWDYFDRYTAFKEWITQAQNHASFINSYDLVNWNIDKHYFNFLMQKGVTLPPTHFIEKSSKIDLKSALNQVQTLGFNPNKVVLKPCIAGGARHTYAFKVAQYHKYEAIFEKLIAQEAMMLQEFQESIVTRGEVSLMVFGGQYTHAVLKKAKKGDFRVQDDWGGTVQPYQPTPAEIDFALFTVQQCPNLPHYARVDICTNNNGKIALVELEIFEPELWFRLYPKAATVLAQNLKKQLFT